MTNLNFLVLKDEYNQLFATCTLRPEGEEHLEELKLDVENVVKQFLLNRDRYAKVEAETKVPWYVIALIHKMEGDCDFYTHLHNGDSLAHRTVNVPSGRPTEGDPPFTWEYSARDALCYDGLDSWDWTGTKIAGILYKLESYNGFGRRLYHPNVLTPYLWGNTYHHTKGKYTVDGKFDPDALSIQIGVAAYLKEMESQGILSQSTILVPKHGGKAQLKVLKDTFLKQSEAQSLQLPPDQKVAIAANKTFPLLAYQQQNDHFRVTLDKLSFNGKNTWLVFGSHVEITDA